VRSHDAKRSVPALVGVLAAAWMFAGCGSADPQATDGSSPKAAAASSAVPTADLAADPWLLRFNTDGGADGELTSAVYIRFTPATGAVTVQRLPGLDAPDTDSDAQAILVSAAQKYALHDAGISRADRSRGRLTLYPTSPGPAQVVNLRTLTGNKQLRPVGAAFDPVEPAVLRVVAGDRSVWRVDLTTHKAVRAGQLPRRSGWIFANGFDKNSGLPYIEDVNTTATLPAGNGDDDVRPVTRRGGVLWIDDGSEHTGEPPPPCGFAGGFTTADKSVWIFCADTPRISAYVLKPGGSAWKPVGKASKAVVPATASELPVVLPPVG
jgi:hypothetical protein